VLAELNIVVWTCIFLCDLTLLLWKGPIWICSNLIHFLKNTCLNTYGIFYISIGRNKLFLSTMASQSFKMFLLQYSHRYRTSIESSWANLVFINFQDSVVYPDPFGQKIICLNGAGSEINVKIISCPSCFLRVKFVKIEFFYKYRKFSEQRIEVK
jgi:hypothetical protein